MQTQGPLCADRARTACDIVKYLQQGSSTAWALVIPPRPNSSHESSYG